MRDALWRGTLAVSTFLLFIVIFETYLLLYTRKPVPEVLNTALLPWMYHVSRDSHNTGLTREQCRQAFPDLYHEVDRAVSYWKVQGHRISEDDIDIGWRDVGVLRVLIYNNELRIVETKEVYAPHYRFGKRTFYTLLQIHRALLGASAVGEQIPNIEFSITVADGSNLPEHGTNTIWTYDRRVKRSAHRRAWLMPDFQYYASPPYAGSFSEMQRKAQAQDSLLRDKIPKAVWRGRVWTNKQIREPLINATDGKDWADVMDVAYNDDEDVDNLISMDNLCKYMFVIHTEGVTWSGRLKYLLNCDSVPIIHKLEYTAEFYHLLKSDGPDQNYVEVERDWSDLESKVHYYLDHPEEAQRIGNNVKATFRSRYTSPAAEACYWRSMMHGFGEVAFDPEPFEDVTVNIAGLVETQRHLRGWSFEQFLWYDERSEVGWGFQNVSGAG